jgi:hypothetical protein
MVLFHSQWSIVHHAGGKDNSFAWCSSTKQWFGTWQHKKTEYPRSATHSDKYAKETSLFN